MSEPHVEEVRSLEEEALHCVRCGLCLSVCPAYRNSLNETDSPRARVALVRAVREGILDAPDDAYASVSSAACSVGHAALSVPAAWPSTASWS